MRGEIKAANAAGVQATYWNAVAHADYWLGEVVARLKARGVWDDTILIVTGDHGEDLFEDVDLSRTLGWFTSAYPVRLTPSGELGDSITK